LVKVLLLIISWGYGLVVRALRGLYALGILPSYQPLKPVISIGNLTVGGTGKTPLVLARVQALTARSVRAATLARGHMPAGQTQAGVSDEACMMRERLPEVSVLTGADRRRSIQEFLKNHAVDVFVCDDAFQHWPLKRNLDIVVIDAV